jgi:hypothetical protein
MEVVSQEISLFLPVKRDEVITFMGSYYSNLQLTDNLASDQGDSVATLPVFIQRT